MKICVLLMCLLSLTLAEPPIGDRYPTRRSQNDHIDTDHQRSVSQKYGPPTDALARNTNGYEYDAPNARNSPNTRRQSQHPPPTVRVSFNQRFGATKLRNSAQSRKSSADKTPSQGYKSNEPQNSQENNGPASRSLPQKYGAPVVSARTPSNEYGAPNARSRSSQENRVSKVNSRNEKMTPIFKSVARTSSEANSAQTANTNQNKFNSTPLRSNNVPRGQNAPKLTSDFKSTSSSGYDIPSSAKNSDSQEFNSPKSHLNMPSTTYGAPNARGLSQEYGVPSKRTNSITESMSSTRRANARSFPSSTYLPANRNSVPSERYGVPDQSDASNEGYDYAKAKALEELQNQEPANYDFAYQIEDQKSGSDFGHTETREENRAEGSYFVVLPDGTKQTVEYEADERGFKPRISVEPADASEGYDENAADITESPVGPY